MKQEILVPFYRLNKGDKARMGDAVYTFIKVDGMYAKWEDEEGKMATGQHDYYTLGEDGIYY